MSAESDIKRKRRIVFFWVLTVAVVCGLILASAQWSGGERSALAAPQTPVAPRQNRTVDTGETPAPGNPGPSPYPTRARGRPGQASTVRTAAQGSAFPGASGYGAMARGGRGGRVIAVTNLNDSGPGSLRAAATSNGPRTVVFRVAGIIDLLSPITIRQPYVTIAGQTAPGGGVTLRGTNGQGRMISVYTHDVIIRYLRVRSGAIGKPGRGQVNIQINSGARDVIVDHCSLSWTLDENFNITRNIPESADAATWPQIYNITLQRSLLAEGLIPHSTGTRVGGEFARDGWRGVHHITIHHNLYLANNARNPSVGVTGMKVINNVVYQWGSELAATTAGAIVDWIGNYYLPGNLSARKNHMVHNAFDKFSRDQVYATPSLFMSGNLMVPDRRDWDLYTIHYTSDPIPASFRRTKPLAPALIPVAIETAEAAYESVLNDVGANARLGCDGQWIMNSDSVDERLRSNVAGKRSYPRFVSNPSEVGGYPAIDPGVPCPDADGDGMPDAWELASGLDLASDDSAGFSLDPSYTNIEVYLKGR